MTQLFIEAFIYLIAAVVAVPIAKRIGLGSVLGYLIAGVIIGPISGLVGEETNTIQHFAEFGVVMMLFIVGLELEPKAIWAMRHKLVGLGGLQVLLTVSSIAGIFILVNVDWRTALAIGLIFSLSSTAIVLQTFNEKGLMKTEGARNAFSILLFQDIAVIPMLALIPLLALPHLVEKASEGLETLAESHEEISIIANLDSLSMGIVIIASICIVVVAGHYLSRPLFRYVAQSGLREIFTAATLMIVIGISALMSLVGLSPALGTFLAGVVLANSEFRHELETNIEPFKGLLLGLFFITVGAGINIDMLMNDLTVILMLTLGLMMLKTLILVGISFIFKIRDAERWLLALSLGQAGEFGFVLLGFSVQNHVLGPESIQLLSLVVAMSMFLTPGLFIFYDKVILGILKYQSNPREPDEIDEKGSVIIAGVGRFGQIVNRLLVANSIATVVLDHQASQIDNLRKINVKGYFGDASRPEMLEHAGISEARLFVVAIDNPEVTTEVVAYVKKNFPHVKVLARAFDRGHDYALKSHGADYIVKETYHSALDMGAEALRMLGTHPFIVEQQQNTFISIEKKASSLLYESWLQTQDDKNAYEVHYQHLFLELEETLKKEVNKDRLDRHNMTDREWTPPPKESHNIKSNTDD